MTNICDIFVILKHININRQTQPNTNTYRHTPKIHIKRNYKYIEVKVKYTIKNKKHIQVNKNKMIKLIFYKQFKSVEIENKKLES